MKKICVIGMGYIGLPTALLFATNGYNVVGVDINSDIVDKVNNKISHLEEEGLEELLEKMITLQRALYAGHAVVLDG